MALKEHKRAITRLFLVVLILFLLCFGLFSCMSTLAKQGSAYVDLDNVHLIQLDQPEPDAPAMRMETSAGDIVAILYPEQAPAYVAQFQKLAEEGYYDGTYVFQVEQGVYFEAGTPNADGSLKAGTDDTYEKVEQELTPELWPFRGAFCVPVTSQEGGFWSRLTNSMKTYCGTRFAVCNSIEFDAAAKEELSSVAEKAAVVNDAFLEQGGIPNYSQQMTIFAQAYGADSFAVIDKITGVDLQEAQEESGYTAPKEDIQILHITFGTLAEMSEGETE